MQKKKKKKKKKKCAFLVSMYLFILQSVFIGW